MLGLLLGRAAPPLARQAQTLLVLPAARTACLASLSTGRPCRPPLPLGGPSTEQLPSFRSGRPAERSPLLAMPRTLPAGLGRGDAPSVLQCGSARHFSTRNLRGRLFYKRRPKMVPTWKFNQRTKWLEGAGNRKGVCTKVFVANARKPNSGLRKVCYVRLSNGRVVKAYIPGIGHNLQVHSVVMIRGGRHADVIGCNYTCMRGQYDLLPVKNRKKARSKYGVTRPNVEPKRKRFQSLTTAVDRRLHFYRTGTEVGSDDPIEKRVLYTVRNNAPITYRHSKPKKKSK